MPFCWGSAPQMHPIHAGTCCGHWHCMQCTWLGFCTACPPVRERVQGGAAAAAACGGSTGLQDGMYPWFKGLLNYLRGFCDWVNKHEAWLTRVQLCRDTHTRHTQPCSLARGHIGKRRAWITCGWRDRGQCPPCWLAHPVGALVHGLLGASRVQRCWPSERWGLLQSCQICFGWPTAAFPGAPQCLLPPPNLMCTNCLDRRGSKCNRRSIRSDTPSMRADRPLCSKHTCPPCHLQPSFTPG
jgi:hypothetical protein